MADVIVTGGTTGLTDGTVVSSGNKLTFPSMATVLDAHIRTAPDTYSTDVTFDNWPAELEISFNAGSTWKGSADMPLVGTTGQGLGGTDIWDVNYPIKLRQVAVPPSADDTFTTDGTFSACTAVSTPTLTATANGATQVDLSWTNVSDEDGYVIERGTDGVSYAALTTKAAGVTTHSDTGLTTGQIYYYRVKATGSGRNSDSGWGTDDATPVFADVTGFAAVVSGTTAQLSWDAVSGADHYLIEWGTDGVTYGNSIDSVSGTTYNHTGRSANSVYYYRIKAHNAGHTVASAGYDTCGAYVQRLFTAAHSRQVRAENATFATARSGGGTNTAFTTDHTSHYGHASLDTGVYYLDRMFMEWDTSAVSSGATINEAWLRITGLSNPYTSNGLAICKGTYSNSPAVAGDFASVTITDLGGPTGALTVNTPTDYAITSPDSNLTKNGTSRLVLLERAKDYGNTAPTTGNWGHQIAGLGNGTSDYRPQLKISYGF